MTNNQHHYQFRWPQQLDNKTGMQLVELYNDALLSGTYLGYTSTIEGQAAQALIEGLDQGLKNGAQKLMLCFDNERLVATCMLKLNTMPNCKHQAEVAKGIAHSSTKGTGCMMIAFQAVAEQAQALGVDTLVMDVRENSRPHQLWSRLGFVQYGRIEDYARIDGVSHAGVYLQQSVASLQQKLSEGINAQRISDDQLLSKSEFKQQLRAELEAKITMTHPIIQRVVSDEANWKLLRFITLQGYQLTKNFLEYIETLYFHCPRGIHKKRLLINMFEEETGQVSKTKNHVALMQDFIRAIGVSDEERDAVEPLPATKELIDHRMELVRNPYTFHLGAAAVLVASEGQNLETTAEEARHDLLPRLYHLTEKDLLFFSVHQKEDVGHVTQGIDIVAAMCTTAQMQQDALAEVRKTCDLFYAMYTGIAAAYED